MCLLTRKYLSSPVNDLTNSLKILNSSKTDLFQLYYVHSNQEIWQRCGPSGSDSVWARLPCCFWKGPLKEDFPDIYLITFFGVRNFGSTSPMRVIFSLLKKLKIKCRFQKCRENSRKSLFFLR